jgi:hypothetical protein
VNSYILNILPFLRQLKYKLKNIREFEKETFEDVMKGEIIEEDQKI